MKNPKDLITVGCEDIVLDYAVSWVNEFVRPYSITEAERRVWVEGDHPPGALYIDACSPERMRALWWAVEAEHVACAWRRDMPDA